MEIMTMVFDNHNISTPGGPTLAAWQIQRLRDRLGPVGLASLLLAPFIPLVHASLKPHPAT